MIQGTVPFLTNGAFALFLGDPQMVSTIEDRPPGRALPNLMIISIIFQVLMWCLKGYYIHCLQPLCTYAQSLRTTLVNGVVNIYGLISLLLINVFTFITLLRQRLMFFKLFKLLRQGFILDIT